LKSNTETVADGADANLSTGIEIEIDGDDLVLKASAPPPDRPACEYVPNQDPTPKRQHKGEFATGIGKQVGSRSAPIWTPPRTKFFSEYQGVVVYRRWGSTSVLINKPVDPEPVRVLCYSR
jgi:hypothetical protein